MTAAFRLQTAASVVVLCSFLASDVVAYLLHAMPTSPLLWYLSIEVLRPFDPFGSLFQGELRFWLTPVTIPVLIITAMVAYRRRLSLIIGLFANLALIVMIGLACARMFPTTGISTSLASIGGAPAPGLYLLLFLGALATLGALASHWYYLRQPWQE